MNAESWYRATTSNTAEANYINSWTGSTSAYSSVPVYIRKENGSYIGHYVMDHPPRSKDKCESTMPLNAILEG